MSASPIDITSKSIIRSMPKKLTNSRIAYSPEEFLSEYKYCSEITSSHPLKECLIGLFSKDPEKIRLYLQSSFYLTTTTNDANIFFTYPAFEHTHSPLIIKSEHNPIILHEVVVGLGGINDMRLTIPNFSQVYGTVTTGEFIFTPEKKSIMEWGINQGKVNYIFYEMVQGIPLRDCCHTLSGLELLKIILCLTESLKQASKECDFNHNDLHDDNIIIQTFPYPIEIKYEDFTIHTHHVPIIIDYGYSHIVTSTGINAGVEFELHDIHNYYSTTLKDIFKLIFSLLETFSYYPNSPGNGLIYTLSKFFSNDPDEIINRADVHKYYVQDELLSSHDENDFLMYIEKKLSSIYYDAISPMPDAVWWRNAMFPEKIPECYTFEDAIIAKTLISKRDEYFISPTQYEQIITKTIEAYSSLIPKIFDLLVTIDTTLTHKEIEKRFKQALIQFYSLKRTVNFLIKYEKEKSLELYRKFEEISSNIRKVYDFIASNKLIPSSRLRGMNLGGF